MMAGQDISPTAPIPAKSEFARWFTTCAGARGLEVYDDPNDAIASFPPGVVEHVKNGFRLKHPYALWRVDLPPFQQFQDKLDDIRDDTMATVRQAGRDAMDEIRAGLDELRADIRKRVTAAKRRVTMAIRYGGMNGNAA